MEAVNQQGRKKTVIGIRRLKIEEPRSDQGGKLPTRVHSTEEYICESFCCASVGVMQDKKACCGECHISYALWGRKSHILVLG